MDFIVEELIKGAISAGFLALGGTLAAYFIKKMIMKMLEENETIKAVKALMKQLGSEKLETKIELNLPKIDEGGEKR